MRIKSPTLTEIFKNTFKIMVCHLHDFLLIFFLKKYFFLQKSEKTRKEMIYGIAKNMGKIVTIWSQF